MNVGPYIKLSLCKLLKNRVALKFLGFAVFCALFIQAFLLAFDLTLEVNIMKRKLNTKKSFREVQQSLPTNEYKWLNHIYYTFTNGKRTYSNQDSTSGSTASKLMHPLEVADYQQLKQKSTNILKHELEVDSTEINCSEMRHRFLPTVGVESEVLCYVNSLKRMEKVAFLQSLNPHRLVSQSSAILKEESAPKVNFAHLNVIISLKGQINTFKLFLKHFAVTMKRKETRNFGLKVGLTVVYFDDKDSITAKQVLTTYTNKVPNIVPNFILVPDREFSRSFGLGTGLRNSSIDADVIFFCDVDLTFDFNFLRRCLTTPILGKQIYFPITFSLYNPKLNPIRITLQRHDALTDEDGYWRLWGYGMVCGYKEDFEALKAFKKSFVGWGGEDIHLLKAVAADRRYAVIRSLEPGLFHRYHEKTCTGTKRKSACHAVKYRSEAAKSTLAYWYYKLKKEAALKRENQKAP